MESWQKSFVFINNPRLISCTRGSEPVLKELLDKRHLTLFEYGQLSHLLVTRRFVAQARMLYNVLEYRVNSYDDLVEVLQRNGQMEPACILKTGRQLHKLVQKAMSNKDVLIELNSINFLNSKELFDLTRRPQLLKYETSEEYLYNLILEKLEPAQIAYFVEILENLIIKKARAARKREFEKRKRKYNQTIF